MAVSVKDFLDAIRGRFNDEPNKVEVTGSNIDLEGNSSFEELSPGSSLLVFEGELNEDVNAVSFFSNSSGTRDFTLTVNFASSVSRLDNNVFRSRVEYDFTDVREIYKILHKKNKAVRITLQNNSSSETFLSPNVNFIKNQIPNEN